MHIYLLCISGPRAFVSVSFSGRIIFKFMAYVHKLAANALGDLYETLGEPLLDAEMGAYRKGRLPSRSLYATL